MCAHTCICVSHIFIHSSINGHLDCFCILAIVNNTEMNICMHVTFQASVFSFFEWISKNGVVTSYGSYIFNFLRNLHSVFHSGCTNLWSHWWCPRITFSSHSHQHLFVVFFIIDILTGVQWCLIVVLICISLIIQDAEHLFMCLLAICMSFGKTSIRVLCPF